MSNEERIRTEVEAAFVAGQQQIRVVDRTPEHEAHAIVPQGTKLEQLPLRKQVRPEFIQARRLFHDPIDFIAYVNQFSDADSRIWFDTDGRFVCVLDDHEHHENWAEQKARHGDHLAVLHLRSSPEWVDWLERNTVPLDQMSFGEFIEDHVADFIEPDAADMLEIATQFDATKNVKFKSATRMQDAQSSLVWQEEIEGKVIGSELKVPQHFMVALRPFYGTKRYKIKCMFRYRFGDGRLRLHYKMIGTESVLEAVIEEIAELVAEQTSIKPALGSH